MLFKAMDDPLAALALRGLGAASADEEDSEEGEAEADAGSGADSGLEGPGTVSGFEDSGETEAAACGGGPET